MSSDPNRWVQNPPSVFVKVHGTSRESMNNKFGLVVQFAADKQRYTVLMCESQDAVSLKTENLVVCGMMEKSRAYLQMFRNNRDIQRQWQSVETQIRQRTGLSPKYAGVALLAILVVGWYLLGFSKVLLLITALMMILSVIGVDVAAGRDWRSVARMAPSRWRELVRTQIPLVGPRIAASKVLLTLFTAALGAFLVYSLAVTPAATTSAPRRALSSPSSASNWWNPWSPTAAPPMAPMPTSEVKFSSREMQQLQQQYYKLGFDDATAAKAFGASLPDYGLNAATLDGDEASASKEPSETTGDYAWRDMAAVDRVYDRDLPLPPVSPKKSPFGISTALAAFTIYRMLQPMAVNAEGRLDWDLFRANLYTMEVWKLGLVAFSVYRLVASFL
jgi:hypothetical protein